MTTLGAPPNRIFGTDADFEEEPAAKSVRFDGDHMYVLLQDGRELKVPLILFPRLYFATPEQRQQYQLGASGEDIHWEELDEDILVANLLLPPDQVSYYNDEFLQRILANPETRQLYEQQRHLPISWQVVNMEPEIAGLEELLTAYDIITDIVKRFGASFDEASEYMRKKTDEVNLANLSPNAQQRRAQLFLEITDFIRAQTKARQKDNDTLEEVTEAFAYNVDNTLVLPTHPSGRQQRELLNWLAASEDALPSIEAAIVSFQGLRESYGGLIGRHPLLSNAVREARTDMDRLLANTVRFTFALRLLINMLARRYRTE